eukprot:gene27337-biopygen9802
MPIPRFARDRHCEKRGGGHRIGSFDSSSIPVLNTLLVTLVHQKNGHCYNEIDERSRRPLGAIPEGCQSRLLDVQLRWSNLKILCSCHPQSMTVRQVP